MRCLAVVLALVLAGLTWWLAVRDGLGVSQALAQDEPEAEAQAGAGDDDGTALFSGEALRRPPADFGTVRAEVKPYRVTATLNTVGNLRAFTKARPLSTDERSMLARNLFVVTPTDQLQLFYIYENNDYLNLPSFVTVDAALQVHHEVFDYVLRTTEAERLLPVLEGFVSGVAAKTAELAAGPAGPSAAWNEACQRNAALIEVAARLLDRPTGNELPASVTAWVEAEMTLLGAHDADSMSPILGYKFDYTQFIPRGHYVRSDDLKRFFLAMMWLGRAGLPTRDLDGNVLEVPVLQSLMLSEMVRDEAIRAKWQAIYEPTAQLVGIADDLTPIEWDDTRARVGGKDSRARDFADPGKLSRFVADVERVRPPRVLSHPGGPNAASQVCQFRLFGQRYTPDGEVFSRVTHATERPFPVGLDAMAALGSERAAAILDADPAEYNPGGWAAYVPRRQEITAEFAAMSPEFWTKNVYCGWLNALRALFVALPEGYPSFMRSQAWQDKSANTALASWAELRHDTILYAKATTAECGDEPPPELRGYVEPNVVLYDRLLRSTAKTYEVLRAHDLLTDAVVERFTLAEDLLTFLISVSEKELRNEPLTPQEYEKIRYLGSDIEWLTLMSVGADVSSWSDMSESDQDMAVVADVHSGYGFALEEAVGRANEILVIVPIEGKLTLTRGACLSYYEFKEPASNRLTGQQWRERLSAGQAPPPPKWTSSFLLPAEKSGAKGVNPEEYKAYSSGC